MSGGVVQEARIALGSVAPVPLRLAETEKAVKGKPVDPALLAVARKAAAAEIRPIDDIRSTVRYRSAVAANLVAEFLEKLSLSGAKAQDPRHK
jgi:CO/xanthine dehydrogenase FAD-binding subunit